MPSYANAREGVKYGEATPRSDEFALIWVRIVLRVVRKLDARLSAV